MPNRTISLKPINGPASITAINCGSSSPRLGGTLDVSAFPNLTSITCNGNGITKFQGYGPLTNLVHINLRDNAFDATQGNFETLSNKPNLQTLDFAAFVGGQYSNWTGTFPDLTANVNLRTVAINNSSLTGSNLNFSTLTNVTLLGIQHNRLTGNFPILPTGANSRFRRIHFSQFDLTTQFTGTPPLLTDHPNCTDLLYYNNNVSGAIQPINVRPNLGEFWCNGCFHTGNIPSFSGLTTIRIFRCDSQRGSTKLTGFAGGPVPSTLGEFRAENNQLTSTAVNAILAAFVAAGRTTGTRILNLGGTGNAAPTGQGLTDKATLISRGWTVTTN